MVKNMPANAGDTGDMGSIPGLGRVPGEGYSNPLQYSCLEKSMDRGAWRATVHGVMKSWMELSTALTVLIHLKDPFQCQSNIYHNGMWNN